MVSRTWLLVVSMLLAVPGVVRAEDGTTIDPNRRSDPAAYRGRPQPTKVEDVLLWGPRILFFPFHLFAEWGLRRPLYAASGWAEREHIVAVVSKILAPTPDFQWNPTFVFDLGTDAAGGATMTTRNLFVRGNELHASVSGGLHALEFDAQDRWQSGPVFVGVRQYTGKRVRPFYGLGPDSPDVRMYFTQVRWEGSAFAGFDAKHVRVELSEGFAKERVGPSDVDDPTDQQRFDPRALPTYNQLELALLSAGVRIDSRAAPDENGGVRVLANAVYAQDVLVRERSFVTTELDAEVAVEVSKPDRVVTARFYGADSLPLGREPVPLTHLPMLGWRNHLGFVWGRFRGDTALMAEVRYRWPIAYFGDAQIAVSAGNVFSRDLKDFDAGKLTTSFAVGIRTRRTGLAPLELMVGFGTTRFEQSFAIESVRLYLGTTDHL